MNNHASQRPSRAPAPSPGARLRTFAAAAAILFATGVASAMPVVTTISGGPTNLHSRFYGYMDGPTQGDAQYHTPMGIALDPTGTFLYVADRDNNAVRQLDFSAAWTSTFASNGISKPVGVAVDGAGFVYVLNRGDGTDGSVLKFDTFGYCIDTNAVGLPDANGIALDALTNIYVTEGGNTVIEIAQGLTNTITTLATVTNAGAELEGIVVMDSGFIAVCDSGRNGIYQVNPTDGTVTPLTGFNGSGDAMGPKNFAKFFQPMGVAKAGGSVLIVTDYGNNRVKVVDSAGTVTNFYGVSSNFWVQGSQSQGIYPGWFDGTVCAHDAQGCPEARLPVGVAFAPDTSVYTTEDYYHLIRKVTSTSLPPPPPPPPPVPQPAIGWVSFPAPLYVSLLVTNAPFIFNNDVIIAILGTEGTETHFTFGPTSIGGLDTIPDPGPTVGAAPPSYSDGLMTNQILPSLFPPMPDVTVKAIGTAPGRASSGISVARFIFKAASPLVTGANAASFTVSDTTSNAQMWYTTDGSEPTNALPSIGPIASGVTLSLNATTNLTFRIRAFRDNYEPSDPTLVTFTTNSFLPNSISFGFASGEASSEFIASPGQFFYAPITLSTVAGTKIYSLQFNVTVTNLNSSPPVVPGALGFQSFLEKPAQQGFFITIPPAEFLGGVESTNPPTPPPGYKVFTYNNGWFQNLVFVNSGINLLGVGWLERAGHTNLYDTTAQDLIKYSQAHDTTFLESNFKIIVGGYAFQVPPTAAPGSTYGIQIGRPSATSDGIGAPGFNVFIAAPTNGPISAAKTVTIGQRKYIAGDCAPFRWFNAGDFGDSNLDNSDVEQVFEAAIYGLDTPPAGSDFFDSMDSAGATYVDLGNGYLQFGALVTSSNAIANLYDGDDTSINQIAFGDGHLDVTDVYVTFRRSLDPSLTWFRRFWTNGILAAEIVPNGAPGSTSAEKPSRGVTSGLTHNTVVTPVGQPAVNFVAGDTQTSAGQTVSIPITAQIFGSYPLRVLMLNLSVNPLDGSPSITSPIQFNPNPALGTPTLTDSSGNANYAAAWLDSTISGLSSNAVLGTLVITIPSNATASSAYTITFDHASASPNGIAAFAPQHHTGLITLSDRSTSSYGDGIPDSWRLRYFGTIYNVLSQASADADGDGMNNWQEYIAGTDPTDPTSLLDVAGSIPGSGGTRVITWPSVSGKNYLIQRSASLYGQGWTSIATNVGTGGTMEYDDAPTGSVQFYRVQVLP